MAADRGAFIDQSQSLNIHIAEPNYGKLTSMHFHAFKLVRNYCLILNSFIHVYVIICFFVFFLFVINEGFENWYVLFEDKARCQCYSVYCRQIETEKGYRR